LKRACRAVLLGVANRPDRGGDYSITARHDDGCSVLYDGLRLVCARTGRVAFGPLCVQDRIPKRFGLDPVRDIQVLCPMNRGGLGARSLNIELQNALNPPGEIRVERFGWTFCAGDKVMQVENDYDKDVYNGDLGVVSRIDMEEGELVAAFDGREIVYGFGELDELVLAYATTIHTRARARNTRLW
jgi:ATP-dependent RecD-like DNA helicase SH3 domain